jgi:riboflavin synthase
MAKVSAIEKGESWFVRFEFPKLDRRYLWTKGSVTLNGVSLTVNKIVGDAIEVCLIPETILRTNLKELAPGDSVTVEYDYWAKAFVNFQEQREAR